MNNNAYAEEPKVQAYLAMLEGAGCTIESLNPQALFHKRNKELLFGVFEIDAIAADGNKLLPYIVIRGNACVIVTKVRNRQSGEERFLMIRQYRTGSGQHSLEFPAGMLDRNISDPASVALKELHEETGLIIDAASLFPIADRPLFTSVGLQDEAILYYGCVVDLDEKEYHSFEGRIAGEESEGERITVCLMSRTDAEKEASSLQVLLGFYLFEKSGR